MRKLKRFNFSKTIPGLLFPGIFLLFFITSARAQNTITGKVINDSNRALPSVTIANRTSKQSVLTTDDGTFSISAKKGDVLEASSVGYQTQLLTVTAVTGLTFTLQASTSNLNEVVVVGYTTQRKGDISGSVATVSAQQLNQRVATSPVSLLQGKLPGLQTTQGSGEPGNENIQLRVRGVGTFSAAGNDPLVIVDGLPGSLNSLNQNDIETITVLKDAASAAIYGSRGANGVIVVTTKKGKSGKLLVSYTYNVGFSNPVKLPNVVNNSAQYMTLYNQARANSGLQPTYTQAQIDLYQNATDRTKYPNHNWFDDLFKTATVQNHYLNFSGGSDNTTYAVGAGYTSQPGTMLGFDYKKYTLSFDLNSKLSKRISFGANIQARYGKTAAPPQGATDMFLSDLAQTPLYPPQADGKWINSAYSNESHNKNVVAIANTTSLKTLNYYLQGNMFVNVHILDGLNWETRAGGNYEANNVNDFRPTIPVYLFTNLSTPSGNLDVGAPGALNINTYNNVFSSLFSQFTYNKKFGGHELSLLAGYQEQYNNYSMLNAGRINFPTNQIRQLNGGPVSGQTNSGTQFDWAIRSLYGTGTYVYNDKYILAASYRLDGSSRFSNGNKWGGFYSVSGSWRISKEKFFENISFINDLKLRASYGSVGNQNIGNPNAVVNGIQEPYPYQPLLGQNSYAFSNGIAVGFSPSSLTDKSLTWETTQTFDLGIDVAFLQNRLALTADWYNKYTFNILRTAQVGSWLGVSAPVINDGAMRNKGFEAAAQWNDRIDQNFSYTIGANIQGYKNTLESFGARTISGNQIYVVGQPYGSFYLYQWDGIFQSQDDINNYAAQPGRQRSPGDIKLKDVTGDNKVDDNDRAITKGIYPAFQYSFDLGLRYKNFDFSAQLYGSQGQKIYVTGWGIEPFRQGSRPTTDWANAWTPTNHSNTLPRIYTADATLPGLDVPSTYFLKDASFMRLRGAQIGYSVAQKYLDRIGVKTLRIFVAGDNIFTISKYPGLDPERVGSGGQYVTYPQVRTISVGANIQF
ncbi:MAG: TonB-dependent receptor [Niabella sp.]|nr:TonB-dependent receptor [Niabella sp.]